MSDQPTVGEKIDAALASFKAASAAAVVTLSAQGAFGWVMRGDLDKARTCLEALPHDKLVDVVTAAAAMSGLAATLAQPVKPEQ